MFGDGRGRGAAAVVGSTGRGEVPADGGCAGDEGDVCEINDAEGQIEFWLRR